ncbi:hypothetical protein [Candidatus Nitrotoga sp. M5]|uniref:hypothetical protein n=1 Tax=Candidatus Nitrotoga sp. M5 TaxID=2890409 RepID=UPI001EF21229|nr:hypothetical protein [Candidatus Nitrotoga sp. M5]CAH1385161.1 conserved hypothetical protein [Candidatus Nitrotoga sp. M5]
MRYVPYDPKKITLPDGWAAKVAALEALISEESDAEKKLKLIGDHDGYWKELKPQLAMILNRKCWYTEAPQAGTDVDVDHYRPKGRVAELRSKTKSHPGYWWLAFKPDNYRYSCIVANRRRRDVETGNTGGKADHFPIADEAHRAWKPTENCDGEMPDLLDPCKATDTVLLTFKEDGEAMARYDQNTHPRLYRRAQSSIEYYHLNHTDFVRARQKLRDEIDRLVHSAKKYFQQLESNNAVIDHAYEEAISSLREMRQPSAPYSSFCMTYLDQYKFDEEIAGVCA